MHELSLMEALAERVLAVAAQERAEQVLAIHLCVGGLAGVDPQALRTASEIVLAGTCAEGARLFIDEVPAACWCVTCQTDFAVMDGLSVCPGCGTPSSRLLRGRELTLQAIELHP